jgi:hypothetical protein
MRKIPTLFVRDENDRRYVTREVSPGCHWVTAGLGVATRKFDGTCVRYHEGQWWARREVKPGKTAPDGFIGLETDETTGKTVGWEPAEQSSFWKYLQEALDHHALMRNLHAEVASLEPGTYELIGPKINGNPEGCLSHVLMCHGADEVEAPDRSYDGLLGLFADRLKMTAIEGLVFWRTPGDPNAGMVKIKRRDFRELAS